MLVASFALTITCNDWYALILWSLFFDIRKQCGVFTPDGWTPGIRGIFVQSKSRMSLLTRWTPMGPSPRTIYTLGRSLSFSPGSWESLDGHSRYFPTQDQSFLYCTMLTYRNIFKTYSRWNQFLSGHTLENFTAISLHLQTFEIPHYNTVTLLCKLDTVWNVISQKWNAKARRI